MYVCYVFAGLCVCLFTLFVANLNTSSEETRLDHSEHPQLTVIVMSLYLIHNIKNATGIPYITGECEFRNE